MLMTQLLEGQGGLLRGALGGVPEGRLARPDGVLPEGPDWQRLMRPVNPRLLACARAGRHPTEWPAGWLAGTRYTWLADGLVDDLTREAISRVGFLTSSTSPCGPTV